MTLAPVVTYVLACLWLRRPAGQENLSCFPGRFSMVPVFGSPPRHGVDSAIYRLARMGGAKSFARKSVDASGVACSQYLALFPDYRLLMLEETGGIITIRNLVERAVFGWGTRALSLRWRRRKVSARLSLVTPATEAGVFRSPLSRFMLLTTRKGGFFCAIRQQQWQRCKPTEALASRRI